MSSGQQHRVGGGAEHHRSCINPSDPLQLTTMGNSATRCQPRSIVLTTPNYIVFNGQEADDFVKERGGAKKAETDCGALSVYWHGKCIGFGTALSEICKCS